MLEAFGSDSYVQGQGWGPGPQAERGGGGEAVVRAVALGSSVERGPLGAKVELSLLGSGARTSSQARAVLGERSRSKEGTRNRAVGAGWGQLRGAGG